MNAIALLANVGELVRIWEAYVLAQSITGYPTRPRDKRKRENVGERR